MNQKKHSIKLILLFVVIFVALCVLYAYYNKKHTSDIGNELTDESTEETDKSVEIVVPKNDKAAEKLIEAIAIAMSDKAEQDMDAAIQAFQEAASLGNGDAQYLLGQIYFQGIGTASDLPKAAEYFQKACGNGNVKAFKIYGKMLFLGDGEKQNYDESASYFFSIASEDAEASYILGIMANLGMGVPRNADMAKQYIAMAVEMGYDKATAYQDKVFDGGFPMDGTEHFKLTAKQERTIHYDIGYEMLPVMIEEYCSLLEQTFLYDAFDKEIMQLYQIDKTGISMLSFFGNNGYLFHQNKNDGTSLHDYIGDNHFTENELKKIAVNLEAQKQWVESKGAKFILLLIPNKETLYPESLPAYIERVDTVTREDLLVAYLRENTDIEVVYTKDTLWENKDKLPLYYYTDTHANMIGSLFMVSDLFRECYGKIIEPELGKFDVHMEDYMGDLGKFAQSPDRYACDKVYYYPESSVGETEKINSSIMLVGDSFSEFINIEAAYYLNGGVDHRMITEYDYSYHNATQAGFASSNPEYVVWECVERYLDRLK